MSYIDDRHYIELCPNHGLSVITCGWQKCHPGHVCNIRYYPNHSFTFVVKGKGHYTIEDKTFDIHAGQCFTIFPDLSTTYMADEEDPWEYYFAIVTGEDVLSLIRTIGVSPSNPVVPYKMDSEMLKNLPAMVKAGASGKRLGYDVIGYFLMCMSQIVETRSAELNQDKVQDVYVDKAVAYMKTNYPYDISVSGVASYVGIEHSYFYRLFKKRMGVSPREWLVDYRLEQAKKMMEESDISTTEIAHSVGFYDLPHFANTFSSHYGMSPREYRKSLQMLKK